MTMTMNANVASRALQNQINNDKDLKTTEVGKTFEELVNVADDAVERFLTQKGTDAGLQLSAAESLELQRLMGDQSITVSTGTATLKSIKDSIQSAARNI
ncbi:hypothetical protein [Grimontia hollisae]|uniref:hypothetical protein n=1 Tax=Grimontia hollisae TaxID=673 RepID=UPI0012ACD1F3|nr:hypothetical protein [Grimontia hollisae]